MQVVVAEAESRDVTIDLGPQQSQSQQLLAYIAPSPANLKRAGYTMGAAGLASLAIGGVFVAMRQSAVSKLEDQCAQNHCPSSLEDTYDASRRYTIAADVFLAMGVVGVATGAGLVLWGKGSPGSASSPRASRATLIPAASAGLGATVSGVF